MKPYKTIILKTYTVYNTSGEIIGRYHKLQDLIKAFSISTTTKIYDSNHYQTFFKPYALSPYYIRVDISSEIVTAIQKETKTVDQVKISVKIPDLDGEKWKEIPGYPNNYASNKGRFKYDDGDTSFLLSVYTAANKTKRLYHDVILLKITDNIVVASMDKYRTSRVLAKTWIDNTLGLSFKDDKRIVDHIDNNSENENIENLRILENNGANIRAAVYEQGVTKLCKPCYAYNINTKETREYPSTSELVRDIWGKENNGYFYCYYTRKTTTKDGWRIGYDIDEIKSR